MGNYVPFTDEELNFLNNFFCHFRWGDMPYETVYPEGLYRTSLKDVWDETYRTIRNNIFASTYQGENLEEYLSQATADYSDLLLSQTPQQFYEVVDEAVHAVGLSVDEVARTINTYLHERVHIPLSNQDEYFAHRQRLDKFLTPIYRALREKGYNRADIWS